jgi:hypothetical protein
MSVGADANDRLRYAIAGGAALVIVVAVWFSKRKTVALDPSDAGRAAPPPAAIEPAPTIEGPAEPTATRKSPTT